MLHNNYKMNHKKLFAISLLVMANIATSDAVSANRGAAVVPILTLLLSDDQSDMGRRELRLEQTATALSSSQFSEGVTFVLDRPVGDIKITLIMSDIRSGANPALFLNGEKIGDLSNGENVFTLSASLFVSPNELRIGFSQGVTGTWTIVSAKPVVSDTPRDILEAQRMLMRATFGPKINEMQRVAQIGLERWIDEQINEPMTDNVALWNQTIQAKIAQIDQERVAAGLTPSGFVSLGAQGQIQTRMDAWWETVVNREDQLRQRVTYALSQIFSAAEGSDAPLIPFFHDTLARNAFGNYYDILVEVTLNPRMATYLGTVGNRKARTGDFPTVPDENYAREVMQLFSIGLDELNIDGTPRTRNGQAISTYDIENVRSLARVFTGWRTGDPQQSFRPGWRFVPIREYINNGVAVDHDFGAKNLLLGHTNPANLSPRDDIEMALRNIFEHPNVGPFVSFRLIQRLVKSNPSRAYVARVAGTFNDNGRGVRGDMEAVVKAILLDSEALESPYSETGGKVKEPVIAVSQLWRVFGATPAFDYLRYSNPATEFGQKPFNPPTVFGFYEPTFSPEGPLSDRGLLAPEFNILTDNVILNTFRRWDELVSQRDYGLGPVTLSNFVHHNYNSNLSSLVLLNLGEIKSVSGLSDNAQRDRRIINFLDERLLGGLMSTVLREELTNFLSALNIDDTASGASGALIPGLDPSLEPRSPAALLDLKAREAIKLVVMSPEYLVQR